MLSVQAVGSKAGAQECGHCHQDTSPFWPYDDVHQFTGDEPAFSVCSGGGGHYVHDCQNGDPSYTWTPGPCHPPCEEEEQPEELAALLEEEEPVTAARAVELEAKYPTRIVFDRAIGILSVRDCGGATIAVKTENPS
jgi:hypothetical protein